MPEISEIKESNGMFYIEIKRGNKSVYRAKSEDRQSIQDYKSELIDAMKQRLQRGR